MSTPPALLLVGHGTRSQAGLDECARLAGRVRAVAGGVTVGMGFIELAPPPISAAVDELVVAGCTSVVAVPLVLLGAGHAKTDVPASLARARRDQQHVTFRYGRHLGIHPELLAVVDDRLDAIVDEADKPETGVLLVGRGSRDPDANADLAKVARLLWEGRPWPLVEPAFVSLAEPSVPAALDRVRALGARRAVVVPWFLFTGVLADRIHAQAHAWGEAHPDVAVRTAAHLGPDVRVADLVLERHDEARAGGAAANCDTCLYRTALPGFEDRVALPQMLHHHPDDEATHHHAHPPPPADASGPASTPVR